LEKIVDSLRLLTESDAAAYRELRRRALQEHPEAYTATLEEFERRTLDEIAASLRMPITERCTFGAFADDRLVGITAFGRPINHKLRHHGGIYQVYVAPEARSRGLGRSLMRAVIDHARQQEGLEELRIGVTVGNSAARSLYLALGFTLRYVEPDAIKLGERYFDVEMLGMRLVE
jgi:ribosomal protein S18 acetylase RimI-like enzyme